MFRHWVRTREILISVGLGLFVALVALSVGSMLFVLVWGRQRFLVDFWPLDKSRLGPHVVAAAAISVAIVAQNHYRGTVAVHTLRRDLQEVIWLLRHNGQVGEAASGSGNDERGSGNAAG